MATCLGLGTSGANIPFPERWEKMKPVVGQLLKQEDVSKGDWQQLFWDAYAAVLWDEEGSSMLQEALTELIQGLVTC